MSQVNLTFQNKIVDLASAKKKCAEYREAGQTIIFTNGVFDLIHLGHIDYLSKAKALGAKLIVGVNEDDSVRRLDKGAARPIKNAETRCAIMAAFYFVDLVIPFNDDTPLQLIKGVLPHVLVKGGDYNANTRDTNHKDYIVGSNEVIKNGGIVKVIPFLPGHSTTSLEQRILSANKAN